MEFDKPDFIQICIKMNARHNYPVEMAKLHSKNWTWFNGSFRMHGFRYVNLNYVGTIEAQLGSAQLRIDSTSDFDYCVLNVNM